MKAPGIQTEFGNLGLLQGELNAANLRGGETGPPDTLLNIQCQVGSLYLPWQGYYPCLRPFIGSIPES